MANRIETNHHGDGDVQYCDLYALLQQFDQSEICLQYADLDNMDTVVRECVVNEMIWREKQMNTNGDSDTASVVGFAAKHGHRLGLVFEQEENAETRARLVLSELGALLQEVYQWTSIDKDGKSGVTSPLRDVLFAKEFHSPLLSCEVYRREVDFIFAFAFEWIVPRVLSLERFIIGLTHATFAHNHIVSLVCNHPSRLDEVGIMCLSDTSRVSICT